jgi:hypothetical protein
LACHARSENRGTAKRLQIAFRIVPHVIDAALVLLASDGDAIVTSDAGDLVTLARVAGRIVDLIEA